MAMRGDTLAVEQPHVAYDECALGVRGCRREGDGECQQHAQIDSQRGSELLWRRTLLRHARRANGCGSQRGRFHDVRHIEVDRTHLAKYIS